MRDVVTVNIIQMSIVEMEKVDAKELMYGENVIAQDG